uniref:Putative auto-transporter adhesin n=1 Tax=Clandestinovirus TaxID=2831644 RepID=A0A8F8KNQ2_9VIRU|nr:putative auto-transporter adhesin [Clandestinovirus]
MSTLVFRGHLHFSVDGIGKLKADDGSKFFVERKNGELHIKPGGGGIDSNVVINNGSISYSSGGSSYIVNSGSGVSMINGDVYINGSSFNNKVVINGMDIGNVIREEIRLRKMGRSLLDGPSGNAKTETPTPVVDDGSIESYDLTSVVSRIEVQGSSSVHFKNDVVLSENLSVSVSGAGRVRLPGTQLDNLRANISGSGSLDCCQSTVKKANLAVSGSGKINNLHCVVECNASVSGSGNITCTAASSCSTDRSVSGSGKINIQKF